MGSKRSAYYHGVPTLEREVATVCVKIWRKLISVSAEISLVVAGDGGHP